MIGIELLDIKAKENTIPGKVLKFGSVTERILTISGICRERGSDSKSWSGTDESCSGSLLSFLYSGSQALGEVTVGSQEAGRPDILLSDRPSE